MTSNTLKAELRELSLSHYAYRAQSIRENEPIAAQSIECSMYSLMCQAGQAAFDALINKISHEQKILILVGTGNNGGDGYVLAKLLRQQQYIVELASIAPAKELTGDAKTARDEWQLLGNEVLNADELVFADYPIIVDALLGTGLDGDVRSEFADCIERINRAGAWVMSLDIPSGMHADTGKMLGCAVHADMTVTFVAVKIGMLTGSGKELTGEMVLAPLSIEQPFKSMVSPAATAVGFGDFVRLTARQKNSHKGRHGRLLCIGGGKGMSGAIRLSAEAAMRTGAGLVKVFCHQRSVLQISTGRPELMVSDENLAQDLHWADCIVFGPGLGKDVWGKEIFNQVFSYLAHEDKPIVIDADALNLLGQYLHKFSLSNLIITPHPAEAARLLSCATSEVENDRFEASQRLRQKYAAHCILKGAGTVVNVDSEVFVCRDGNPGMATAGMGDVLSGVLGSLLAQGMSSDQAALYGVCLHSAAADICAEKHGQRGMLASDIFSAIRQLVN